MPYRVEQDSRVAGLEVVRSAETGHALLFPTEQPPGARGEWQLDGITLFVAPLDDEQLRARLSAAGGEWAPAERLDGRDGAAATIWRSDRGDVALPFDPSDAITSYWSERYQEAGSAVAGGLKSAARRGYYLARPIMPRFVQIAMRRAFTGVQGRATFPRWPVETSLHDLYERLFAIFRELADRPVPTLAAWPGGFTWALVLTHDVETATGVEHLGLLREIEVELGYRSSWNFVPERYTVDDEVVRELAEAGFEIGVHGLKHDGRDLSSLRVLQKRIPGMQAARDRWGASGFRSPATHRRWEWMPLLGFEYDTSYPDTDPYEPQSGGCCTWLPFFNDGLVELPITLPQDHTIFSILREQDGRLWTEKADLLREHGGMALLIAHPDYLIDEQPRAAYRALLERYAGDETMWRPLARDLARWWRRRAESRIERGAEGWQVVGPAAGEAVIVER